ncbi:coadhesin-like isoform X2 [Paramuricea clavata]|uniref:Coadhesin-like isoform X2 n=1 Tax=Paramuricea clavata TaxID=317549 RepID=A0A6S7IQV2_PARCT|nr:coadhesin-like isoform X2 [Paramuricea clavata]
MWVVCFNNGGGTILTLATIIITNVSVIVQSLYRYRTNRTCIPAEAEPTLKSSSCYPLVNFTRPFCQNHGITLPNYVYQTPDYQNNRNNEANADYDAVVKIGASQLNRFFEVDIGTIRKCAQVLPIVYCHLFFPSCDRTQSVFKEQKICRESYLELPHMCGKLFEMFLRYYIIKFPEKKKLYLGELQPTRNAGDSPECWYFNELAKSTDAFPAPEWATNADCLYLNGSSYHGNISVTASGIPCQSWTEQCPHRHTMNKTYPELNNAKSYCRNPQNSGQRPWCFTTDRNKGWEYCDILKCIPVDGSYSNWSLNSTCNVTCGEGFRTWTRECNNPEPEYGGRNCSQLGEPVEYRPCSAKPCPVNGGYSNWTLSKSCNVSCGDGVEIWRRFCNNPEPKYGGHNCSGFWNSTEFRNCSRTPCPIDGSYDNWTTSPCSATCGQGVKIRIRQCNNPPGKYGGNCSKQGPAQETRICKMKPCPGHPYYARLDFLRQRPRGPLQLEDNNTSEEVASLSQETSTSADYGNVNTSEEVASLSQETSTSADYGNVASGGEPVPGLSRGIVRYGRDYMNTRPARSSWYDRLQLIRPLAMEWLRNAWGNVDEFGRHVYDVMQRVRHVFVPYNKLSNLLRRDSAGSEVERNNAYSTLERSAAVILPTESENASTTENV